MRILLDENVHHGFRKIFADYEVKTVQFMGWSGVKNGKLLQLASEQFDILITQTKLSIITIISKFIKIDDLLPMVPKLLKTINSI
jgi:hypothetical protein